MPTHPSSAVFLSYASQDAEVVRRIAEALRVAGVEVWFDQNELVGGDAWDAKIRGQIARCALFVPVISAATQARREGYFRIEWKLAAQRTHAMADGTPFLLPVVIDATHDAEALVPAEFRAVQWTRLPGGEGAALEKFCARVGKLLLGDSFAVGPGVDRASDHRSGLQTDRRPARPRIMPAILGFAAVAALAIWQPWRGKEKPAVVAASAGVSKNTEVQRLLERANALLNDPIDVHESFRAAHELAQRATTLAPEEGEAWATLATAAMSLVSFYRDGGEQRINEARNAGERAVRLAPHAVDTRLAAASLDWRLFDQPERAESQLIALAVDAPGDQRVARELTIFYQRRGGNAENTMRWAKRADAIGGGDPVALNQIAWVAYRENRLADVLPAIETSLRRGPSGSAYHLRLIALLAKGDWAAGRAVAQETPAVIMRQARSAVLAYELLLYLGEPERALEAIARVPQEFFEERGFFFPRGYLAGEALLAAGKRRAADLEFATALKAVEARLPGAPRDAALAMWRAKLLLRLGERAAGETQMLTAQELGAAPDPVALVLLEKTDEALAAMDRAIQRETPLWPLALQRFRGDPVFAPLRGERRYQAIMERGLGWLSDGSSTTASTDDKSVAVLAFANRSDDAANEIFSDGISEELINVLGRVPGLTVKGRASSFYFKNSAATAQEKGQKLGATFLVDGSVRKMGNTVRITAQVIRAAMDEVVWSSEPLEREVKDVFAVQEEIAGMIAKALSLKLGVAPAAAKAELNPEAYRLYVQARQAWNLRTPAGYTQAERLLERALELSPRFARAQAAQVDVALLRAQENGLIGAFEERNSSEQARLLAQIEGVLAVDSELPEARASLGFILGNTWKGQDAERELRRAVTANPNYATARQWLGVVLVAAGRMDDGLAEMKLAAELDPLAPRILDNYGWVLNLAGRYDEAIVQLNRALTLQPDSIQALGYKAVALAGLGRFEEAVRLAGQLPATRTDIKILVLGAAGLRTNAETLLKGLNAADNGHHVGLLLAAGQRERALSSLAATGSVQALDSLPIVFDPLYDEIRSDARFVEFLATLSLTESHARAQAWRAKQQAGRAASR